MTLRPYQEKIIDKAMDIISRHKFVYLAMQVRTGKTLTALGIADKLREQSDSVTDVLFVTKKKAIQSIEDDVAKFDRAYSVTVVNYESLHKIPNKRWSVVVVDEAHRIGAFPKPNLAAKFFKSLTTKQDPIFILLSGTPTPESYSQMYHQVYYIKRSPFAEYSTFYRFANHYVKIRERYINSFVVKDYSDGSKSILEAMRPFTINYTQEEAGFTSEIVENVLTVKMSDTIYKMADKLRKDLVIEGRDEVILADTSVKLLSKLHQLYSGTIKFESGNSMVIDDSKARFIHSRFTGKKVGIFYKFKEELQALLSEYGDELTEDLEEFRSTDKSIALQILSGREGISLKEADCLVYYNIDFSATSYWQSRDRMTTIDRKGSDVYWIFADGGIEKDIYDVVKKKKNYTINHFKLKSL
jgi:hypothetical protein